LPRISTGTVRRWAATSGKAPDEATIVHTRAEWAAFVAGVKDGEFDYFHPTQGRRGVGPGFRSS
jgi:hypothetical protein